MRIWCLHIIRAWMKGGGPSSSSKVLNQRGHVATIPGVEAYAGHGSLSVRCNVQGVYMRVLQVFCAVETAAQIAVAPWSVRTDFFARVYEQVEHQRHAVTR